MIQLKSHINRTNLKKKELNTTNNKQQTIPFLKERTCQKVSSTFMVFIYKYLLFIFFSIFSRFCYIGKTLKKKSVISTSGVNSDVFERQPETD